PKTSSLKATRCGPTRRRSREILRRRRTRLQIIDGSSLLMDQAHRNSGTGGDRCGRSVASAARHVDHSYLEFTRLRPATTRERLDDEDLKKADDVQRRYAGLGGPVVNRNRPQRITCGYEIVGR